MRFLERQKNFLDFTLAGLARRKGRNGVLVLVYALTVFLIASVMFFTQSLRNEARLLLADAPEMILQRTMAGRHELIPESLTEDVLAIRGVRDARSRLWGYYFHPAAGANYTVMAMDDFPHDDDRVVLGAGVLRSWTGMRDGRLYFRAYDGSPLVLIPADVLDPKTELVTSDLILVSRAAFRRLFGVPYGMATDIGVSVRNQRELTTISEKIVLEHPDVRVILREEILRTYDSVFGWRGGYVVVLLSGTVLAFLIFAWDKATGLSAEERAEIGILKAIGWDTSDVLAMKFWEGLAVSLTAFLLGTIGAFFHVHLASAPLFTHALKGWSMLSPRLALAPSVDLSLLATLFFLTVLPYTLITVIPAWKASASDPDAVMRRV